MSNTPETVTVSVPTFQIKDELFVSVKDMRIWAKNNIIRLQGINDVYYRGQIEAFSQLIEKLETLC